MTSKPVLMGITGGIGAGKTLVCKIFGTLGIPVYNADERAKWLMENDVLLVKEISALFGPESYSPEGKLNNKAIAQIVFHDSKKLNLLNAAVHPKVADDFSYWVKQNEDYPYLIKEAALLFETGSFKNLDMVVNVSASPELRLKRVMSRDPHRSAEQVNAIMDKQFSEEKRNQMADITIFNDGQQMLIPQVMALHHSLINRHH